MSRFPRTGYGPYFLRHIWGSVVPVPDYDVPTAHGRVVYEWHPGLWMHKARDIIDPAELRGDVPTTFRRSRRTGKLT